jgi:hypothetical protein
MARFMVMILENEAEEGKLSPSETKALVEGHAAYERKLRAVSAYLDGGRLRPSSEGRRIGNHHGQPRGASDMPTGPRHEVRDPRVDAGPFGDRALSGYYVLEAESLEAALRLADECPTSPGAEIDVRPLMKGRIQPDKASQRGRVFAYAVLGNAPNEQGWIGVMDRIDESTREGFPAERFLGGVRLLEPGRGRRVASAGGRRAVFDGPFLESKEVIGGLFFMRMASLDEAVEWASRTEFVTHGALEIRELWRS